MHDKSLFSGKTLDIRKFIDQPKCGNVGFTISVDFSCQQIQICLHLMFLTKMHQLQYIDQEKQENTHFHCQIESMWFQTSTLTGLS